MASVNPNTQKSLRVRIMNIKSGRYLSIEGDANNWKSDDASLTIHDWIDGDTLTSSQVWTILQYRAGAYILINQFSGYLTSIRGQSTDNGATVTQFHSQLPVTEPFQQWTFRQLENNNWLIGNVNSRRFIGPHNRDTNNGNYCIQYDDQTSQDSYQEWMFSDI